MNPCDLIRVTAAVGIELNIRNGKLYIAPGDATISSELLAAIRTHKPAIIAALAGWSQSATLRQVTLDRCRPLVPDDLTVAERTEVETLAAELADSGGLGWFVIRLTGRWNDLSARDRLQAALCWECAIVGIAVNIAP